MEIIEDYYDLNEEDFKYIFINSDRREKESRSDEDWFDVYDDDECLSDPEDISPRNYTYEKSKSILEDFNITHLEKFLREKKLKNINKNEK